MAAGCKNPRAANVNLAAESEDYSCKYVLLNQDVCHYFTDLQPDDEGVVDRSFTMSYSVAGGAWVFFHDYWPAMYFHSRDVLWSTKHGLIHEHNVPDFPGRYHWAFSGDTPQQPAAKSFFIDVVFQGANSLVLETVNWWTEYMDKFMDEQPYKTLTHITIWDSHQHSTRIALSDLQPFKSLTARTTKGDWNLKDFRNLLADKSIRFLQSIFNDFLVDPDAVNADQPWYRRELMTDKWFCIRFEFDNIDEEATVYLHNTQITAIKSDR